MGADLSRVRFDARRDHAGVVLQQGRLLLDADWNELVAILERRIRAEVADLDSPGPATGIGGVAVVPRTTPDAFKVALSGGALTIGRGRMYVDGLLAENHGIGPSEFDPLLAEPHGTVDTPYLHQPYWPVPDALPTAGQHLAYLDVWQREVTYLEAPDLIDQAIGVDTTARTQTAWQVRLFALDVAVSCTTPDADIPSWVAHTAPSGARLTVATIPVPDSDNPCVLPPSDGYRGLENQTYRVEIHAGGQPGKATFSWSRDNGSVVSPVVEVSTDGTGVRLASTGKDDVLRFHDQDWVEFIDDQRELTGIPGELRKVTVQSDDGLVQVTPALPPELRLSATDAAARHLRARRWDQHGQIRSAAGGNLDNLDAAGATGAITVPASGGTSVVLEAGIVVRFSSTGADFRPGDYWIFAARAADASVELLDNAPPLGAHHHYARLGVLTFPDDETDCRTPWPPECDCDGGGCGDCTVCVTPDSHNSGALTIQAAVSDVASRGGGTVCLDAGSYRLDTAVVIDQTSSVTVRGQGVRTVIVADEDGFRVTNSVNVVLEDFTVLAPGIMPTIVVETTAGVSLERLTLVAFGNSDLPGTAIALGGVALLTTVRDNLIVAGFGIASSQGSRAALFTAQLDITGNVLVCQNAGIDLSGEVLHMMANQISCNAVLQAQDAGIRLTGSITPGHGCEVSENTLLVAGSGIIVATAGFTVSGNAVTGTVESLRLGSDGIQVVNSTTASSVFGATRVSGNRVVDVGGYAARITAPVTSLDLTHNLVERAGSGLVMDGEVHAESVVASDNTVLDVGSHPSDEKGACVGMQIAGSAFATVGSNTVHGVGSARVDSLASEGIRVVACPDSRVVGNSVDRIGLVDGSLQDVGILLAGFIRSAQISDNQVRRQSADVDDDVDSRFIGLVVGSAGDQAEPAAGMVGTYVVVNAAAPVVVGPSTAYAPPGFFSAAAVTVDTNIVSGSNTAPTAVIRVKGDVVITGNQLQSRRDEKVATLEVLADTAVVASNRLRGGFPSAALDVDAKRLTVLGNISMSHILVNGVGLSAPWAPLNLEGVS